MSKTNTENQQLSPTASMAQQMTALEVGQHVCFPIIKTRSVRALASDLSKIHGIRLTTRTDAEDKTVMVIRIS